MDTGPGKDDPWPRCKSRYRDAWGVIWRCELYWGHVDGDGAVMHRATAGWPMRRQHFATTTQPTWTRVNEYQGSDDDET